MLKILINAYACCPGMGSEPGMAWNWTSHLAKHCELHIITESEFRNQIEAELDNAKAEGKGNYICREQAENMHFYYNTIGGSEEKAVEIRKRCWKQGTWSFYFDYAKWQKETLLIAREIISSIKIDLVHQLNMIGFREPGYLWKIDALPFFWGPTDVKESFPTEYLYGATLKQKVAVHLKNIITKMQLSCSFRVRKAVRRANVVISASTNSQQSLMKYFRLNSPLLNETGCIVQHKKNLESKYPVDKETTDPLELLWVGKMDFRKQLGLAIKTLFSVRKGLLRLHVVGAGDSFEYKCLAAKLKVNDSIVWHGEVSHNQVQDLMQKSDILFFTSVAEGTPHVVLEAFANGLPVVCFDTCGQGDCVNEKVGVKIPLTNPKQSAKDFAQVLNDLYEHREKLAEMSSNCRQRAEELSWDRKAEQMVELYKKAMNNCNRECQ